MRLFARSIVDSEEEAHLAPLYPVVRQGAGSGRVAGLGEPPVIGYRKDRRLPLFWRRLAEAIIDFASRSTKTRPHHNRWLILIAAFKLSQALLFIGIGVGALQLLHKDVGDVLAKVADHLRFNPESRFINFILDKATLVDDRILRRIGAVVFVYAGLDLLEGIGLYLEKAWGEYLTLAITGSFLPWELFEVCRRLTWVRFGLLVVNALVFLYLFKVVVGRERHLNASEVE